MSAEAFLGDATGGARDLVFVSYCHADAAWVQRVQVLLTPLLRRKQLRLWVDTDLRAGDAWQPEIMRGIERSGVALLLVSADFLASDFIMEHELPALIDHGVRLAPMLVGDCLWKHEPQLEKVQWLHDVGRDGALNLVEGQIGIRDRRLREICERLLEVAPTSAQPTTISLGVALARPVPPTEGFFSRLASLASSGVALERPAPDAARVAEVPVGSVRGELFGVPGLPPGYVVRDELGGLVEAVIAVEGGAVGLTGQVTAVGLHGQGGIGKSVLAAALAHDEDITRRFPGGVYWVTVGQKPDLLGIQLDLLTRLGAAGPPPRTVIDAVTELQQVLAKRRVLLVIDDVWSLDAARAFRVTGPRGRVVYTSRDPRVLADVGARAHRVDVLSPAAARAVAVGVLGGSVQELPPVVDQVFAQVGWVALAVALLSAAVRGGRSWHQIADDLTHGVDVFGAHPYANAFAAMQIAVTELPPALREALLSLAVFPPDTEVPVSAIIRYWAHTRGHTRAETLSDLDRLAEANVLRREGESIGFHDLQHDYLLLHAPLLTHLHAKLLDAYRTLLPPGHREQWWRLPVGEPYIWDQLVRHLRGAGEHAALCATVTDPAYLARRISAGGTHAAETDLAQAAAVLPTEPAIDWWRGWIARHAHLLTVPDRSEDTHQDTFIASTMHAWLSADPTHRAHDINPERLSPLLPTPHLRVRWGLTPPPTALIRVLTGHTDSVRAVAWSPDGTRLATASDDQTVRVWDPTSGTQLNSLTGHTNRVRAVAWSPDGTRLATASDDQTVRVWDPTSGTQLNSLTGHTSWVLAVTWSPDGTRLATASIDQTVRVWDPTSGTQLNSLTGHTSMVWAVTWSPDGTRLATTSTDRTARIWDPTSGTQLNSLTGHTSVVQAVTWSPNGTRLATTSDDRTVRIWDPTSGTQLNSLTGHTSVVQAVTWSPDGTRLATASDDRTVRVWNSTSGKQLNSLTGHIGRVLAVAWSPDGTRLASASDDGLPTASGDGRATASRNQTVRVWDSASGKQLNSLTGHTDWVVAVAWSPDGTRLATASNDQTTRVWDSTSGKQLNSLTGHADRVVAVAWSPDGTRLATASDDRTVRVWDSTCRGCSRRFRGWRRLWGGRSCSGAQLNSLTGHTDWVRAVAWSPDGTRLATASDDRTVRVWDSATGTQLNSLTGHTGGVVAAVWSPDGTRLASASDEGMLIVHELAHDERQIWLRLDPLNDLSWTAAGIAVAGAHGVIVLDLA